MSRASSSRVRSPALDSAILLSHAQALLSRAVGRALSPWDMNWPQALSLIVLAHMPAPITATHLVEQLGLGRTAMTSVVDRLQRRGWVERRPMPRDRRATELLITDAGREVASGIQPVIAGAVDGCFKDVSDLPAFQEALHQVIAAFRDTLAGNEGAGEE